MDFRELVALGAEPTPTQVAAFLVATLEQHGVSSRADLVRAVRAEWLKAGGKPLPDAGTVSRVKKALSMLASQGIVENPIVGRYRLLDIDALPERKEEPQQQGGAEAVIVDDELVDDDVVESESDVGTGLQSVYAFYLPTYRAAAEAAGQTRWPVKVGMTTTSVGVRMAAHRTALPEGPVLTLVVRTDNAAILERVIHGILTLRGLRSDESGGSEWFMTNAEELRAIHEFAVGLDHQE